MECSGLGEGIRIYERIDILQVKLEYMLVGVYEEVGVGVE